MTPRPRAADRLPRLLTLVPYLLARPGVRVSEAAAAFGVSERQLVDDLRLIWMCGLPGHTPADLIDVSWDGGEILVSNADTIARPLRLGVDEAAALLVALRMLAELHQVDRDLLDRVIAKLERAVGDAAAVASKVAVKVDVNPAITERIERGLRDRRLLHLRYYVPGRDENTERDVDPMRLLVVDGRTYLEGWCRRADAVRLFRLDRVLDVTVVDLPAAVPPQAEPVDIDEGLFRPSPSDVLVTFELAPAGHWVARYYPCESVTEFGEGWLRASLRTPDTRWVRRLALRLGEHGRVVAPRELARQIRHDAERSLAHYDH